jgi:branched-chain amino acid transport system permease protein
VAALGLLGLALLAVPWLVEAYWLSMVIEILIFGLFALSVDLLLGHAGIMPLGHAGFFAASAYTAAILVSRHGESVVAASALGVAAAVVLALLFGFAVRTSGVYFILLTLALGEVVWGIAVRWTYTGGDNGVVLGDLPPVAGVALGDLGAYYYVVLAVTAGCALAHAILVRSVFGLTLRGIRESEARMRSLGYNVVAHKFVAFVLSGALAGTAGVLYVYWNKFVSPPTAGLHRSAEGVLMAILGGTGTVFGPFIGSALITVIRNQVSGSVGRWMTIMGIVFILTALYAPDGVLGLWRRLRHAVRARRLAGAPLPERAGGG